MVIVSIKIKVWPVKRKEILQTIHSILEEVQNSNGFVKSDLYQKVDDENEFLLIEEWATKKDSDAHMGSDIFTVLKGAGGLMIRPPKISINVVDKSAIFEP